MKIFASLFVISSALCMSSIAFALELHFEKNKLSAKLSWESGPNEGNESILRMQFLDADQNSTDLASPPKVILWMPDMNHGSGPTSVQRTLDENGNVVKGIYIIKSMYFMMPGLWEVRVLIKDSSGKIESQIFNQEI